MKRMFSMTMALLMLLGLLSLPTFAEGADDTSATVYVTISDDKGDLVLTQASVTVTDTDSDGVLTLHDALYAAHEASYAGGAAAGYSSYVGPYGISLDKLWGVANGGSYGYQLNSANAGSLTDPIENGDYVDAYVYTDLTAWSDTYCYFDVRSATAEKGGELTLTLSAAGYDEAWNPITLPVAEATITVNGVASSYKTDAEGKVTLTLAEAGRCVISATSETQTLVPPVCVVTVEDAQPQTGENSSGATATEPEGKPVWQIVLALIAVAVLAVVVVLVFVKRKKK